MKQQVCLVIDGDNIGPTVYNKVIAVFQRRHKNLKVLSFRLAKLPDHKQRNPAVVPIPVIVDFKEATDTYIAWYIATHQGPKYFILSNDSGFDTLASLSVDVTTLKPNLVTKPSPKNFYSNTPYDKLRAILTCKDSITTCEAGCVTSPKKAGYANVRAQLQDHPEFEFFNTHNIRLKDQHKELL